MGNCVRALLLLLLLLSLLSHSRFQLRSPLILLLCSAVSRCHIRPGLDRVLTKRNAIRYDWRVKRVSVQRLDSAVIMQCDNIHLMYAMLTHCIAIHTIRCALERDTIAASNSAADRSAVCDVRWLRHVEGV